MKPIVVLIRDGWGYRSDEYLNGPTKGLTPYTDYLMKEYPNTLIDAAGEAVGLPNGFQGNSEVGHMTIGSGRIFYQSLVRINRAIEDKSFFKNSAIKEAVLNCKKHNTTLHVCGLIQKEGVHSHLDHCFAILDLCKLLDFQNVKIHAITDGRDSPVNKSIEYIRDIKNKLAELGFGEIATISGRYFAMDRDNRWDRTKKAYDCIVEASSKEIFDEPELLLKECYEKKETDEFIVPRRLKTYEGIKEDDSFIFFNFRIDRPRQLTKAIIEEEFEGWARKPKDVHFVSMTEFYDPMDHRARIAFPHQKMDNLLGHVLAENNLHQLRISETEKYAHVTFFFDGQVEKLDKGEETILIPSPKVPTYDQKPEMSVEEISNRLVEELNKDKFDVVITNFVNGDMVGHTGVWEAVLKATHAVDDAVKKVVEKVLEKNGTVLIFADHGNCEDMTEANRTNHTINQVPFILVNKELKQVKLKDGKGLKDIAPTVLKLLNINQPKEMTGEAIYE